MSSGSIFASRARAAAISALAAGAGPALAQHASGVVAYSPGAGTLAAYQNPANALGEPSRFTPGAFPGAVTPFQSAFLGSQLVQVGRGGELVVALDRPIRNDPSNPFGIDLLVFGNAFVPDAQYPAGVAGGPVTSDGGDIDVSADGVTWFRVATGAADGLFPTLGYSDLADPYSVAPGSNPTDFQQPVDPSFTIQPGTTFAQIVAGYAGSGGGFGVDIASTGLPEARFVRISVDASAGLIPEIDGFAVVPAPAGLALAPAALIALRRRR